MKIISFHLTGNANVKAAIKGFAEAGILKTFYVTIASIPGNFIDKLAKIRLFSEVRRRQFIPLLKPYIRTWPWFEIVRMISKKGGFSLSTKQGRGTFDVDAVGQNLDRHVAKYLKTAVKDGVDAVYAYEDTAVHSFKEAKKLGMQCLYDLPIGYWRTARHLLESEKERWPEWIETIPGLKDWDEKLSRKDEELQLADQIFVASSFTKKTLSDYPGKLAPVHVIPYGFPPLKDEKRTYQDFSNKRALKLLFIGSLSQRKGIADLFAAVNTFGDKVQLTLVGSKPAKECVALENELAKHTYIPSLAHPAILSLMREHDVFIFPSLFEGFGLVITEAMSQGTPVITTDRTCGADLIEDGKNGWLIEAGNTEALRLAIEKLVQQPELIEVAGRAAMETAKKRPWDIYSKELADAVKQHAAAKILAI